MKGGKKGRDPKKRPAGPPPKGSRKRPFGGSSSTGEE